jgi:hypothetical protein
VVGPESNKKSKNRVVDDDKSSVKMREALKNGKIHQTSSQPFSKEEGPNHVSKGAKPGNRKRARMLEDEPHLKEDPSTRIQGREEHSISYSEELGSNDDVKRATVLWDEGFETIDGKSVTMCCDIMSCHTFEIQHLFFSFYDFLFCVYLYSSLANVNTCFVNIKNQQQKLKKKKSSVCSVQSSCPIGERVVHN